MINKNISRREFLYAASAVALVGAGLPNYAVAQAAGSDTSSPESLWNTAVKKRDRLAVVQWFMAADLNTLLDTPSGLDGAVRWCKDHGVTKAHMEAFGGGVYADRSILTAAISRFRNEGFIVQGGIKTLNFGKQGFTSQPFIQSPCYTVKETQDEVQHMFEYAASFFDQVIIDDLYFTDCQCAECIAARGDLAWSAYYCGLMDKLSRERVIKAARKVNPNVKIIIKFPQWYDQYHNRGYDVPGESRIFDGIWIGTESRHFDYDNGDAFEIGYNPYWNMRWLSSFRNADGGWFDAYRGDPKSFVEQARHTVLGGGKEMILWTYSEMIKDNTAGGTPILNMAALANELPPLIALADIVQDLPIRGVHLLKPGNSDAYEEEYVFSFLGNLGIPFVPANQIDENAVAAIFSVHALKDPGFPDALLRILQKGTPVVITDGLAKRLTSHPAVLSNNNLSILRINGSPKTLLNLSREDIGPIRNKLLAPLGITFDAPNRVEFYLFGDKHFAIENINDEGVDLTLSLPNLTAYQTLSVLPDDPVNATISQSGSSLNIHLAGRSLAVVEYQAA
jgi:hypothetical protein